MQRRSFVQGITSLAVASAIAPAVMAQARPQVEVWKDPECGCCHDWVSHMQANGFAVRIHDSGNSAARAKLGVPEKFGSCHTAQVGGYAIEGHVPASDIHRLLKERPKAVGLAAPGMPVGSPGMDGPAYGGRQDRYDVLLVLAGGNSRVYQAYPSGRAQAPGKKTL